MIEVKLGDRVRDKVTGFEGIATGITVWLHGCRRVVIQPEKLGTDGKLIESWTFDEPGLEILEVGARAPEIKPPALPEPLTATGGPITKAPARR
ncbi:MAG: hypothetical protein K2Y22_04280 [Candidatus Obscuribacterales bacterium]|nr:hypothetical protein [Candidatus Obscuribacterales bacterium]